MAYLGKVYSVDELPQQESFEPIPAGWYSATIEASSLETTRDGTGKYIKNKFRIIGPEYANRVVFGNMNIQNKNPEAERIAHQQLSALLQAIGMRECGDTDQLVGRSMEIKVGYREADGKYGASNDVKDFRQPFSQPVAQAAKPAAPAPAARPAAGGSAPWLKK